MAALRRRRETTENEKRALKSGAAAFQCPFLNHNLGEILIAVEPAPRIYKEIGAMVTVPQQERTSIVCKIIFNAALFG